MGRNRSRRRRNKRFKAPQIDHFRRVKITVRGATEKDVLENPRTGARYIAKLGRRHNDLEVMSEYAIFLIGRSLGVRVADARLARYRGRLRFLSKYFLDPEGADELVHGVQLFHELYDENTVDGILGNEANEQAFFSVQAVRAAFGAHYFEYGVNVESELFSGFVSMLAHDALIGVQDRHHENWGVIVQRARTASPPRFAPLYDSARGLFGNAPDPHLGKYLLPGNELDRYIARARPLVGFDGLKPRKGKNHIAHDQLLAAVYEHYPEQRSQICSVLDAYEPRKVRALLRRLEPLCSGRRRALVVACLTRRRQVLLEALSPINRK